MKHFPLHAETDPYRARPNKWCQLPRVLTRVQETNFTKCIRVCLFTVCLPTLSAAQITQCRMIECAYNDLGRTWKEAVVAGCKLQHQWSTDTEKKNQPLLQWVPASFPMSNGAWAWRWSLILHLVPRLRMSGNIPLLPPYTSNAWASNILPYFTFAKYKFGNWFWYQSRVSLQVQVCPKAQFGQFSSKDCIWNPCIYRNALLISGASRIGTAVSSRTWTPPSPETALVALI
jgi:hypothetical protein